MSSPLEVTKRELDAAGIAYCVEQGKKHHKVRFTVCGKDILVICSCSTSDHRAILNARLLVRREIRAALASEQSCK